MRRVTERYAGRLTAGVDGEAVLTPEAKAKLADRGMLVHASRGMVTGLQAQRLAGEAGAVQVEECHVADADRYYKQLAKQHRSAAPAPRDIRRWLNGLRVDHEEAFDYLHERGAAENWNEKLPRSARQPARWGILMEGAGSALLARELANQEMYAHA